jgi:hypothetical protein
MVVTRILYGEEYQSLVLLMDPDDNFDAEDGFFEFIGSDDLFSDDLYYEVDSSGHSCLVDYQYDKIIDFPPSAFNELVQEKKVALNVI